MQALVTLLLYMVADGNRSGYRHLLDAFWDEATSLGLKLRTRSPVSAAAFTKARRKLPAAAVRGLVHQAADAFDDEFGTEHRWFGRRVFAVDGTKMNLRRAPELQAKFGVPKGAYCPQTLVSTLFKLVSKMPRDVVVGPVDDAERAQLYDLLGRVRPGNVLVLDRGYPSFKVMLMLADAGIDFVMRVPAQSTFQAVTDFAASGAKDRLLSIAPPRGPLHDCAPMRVRAVMVRPPKGERTVLLTSFHDRDEIARSDIANLYRMRWNIETFYKLEKGVYLGQGQFHSESVEGVNQEIQTLALFVAIARSTMAVAARSTGVPYSALSPKSACLGFAAYVVRLLLTRSHEDAARLLDRLLARIVRARDPVRPGRSFPRRAFIPTRKWGPNGRRGG